MHRLIMFNKPYQVLCKFTDTEERTTLSKFIPVKDVYPAGRLDYKSEGLVLLTNAGYLQHIISDPQHKLPKNYWAQVEGIPDIQALHRLAKGVVLKDGLTKPAQVQHMEPPYIWPRTPPVRARKNIPTSWISFTLYEGRNRQVRRMTAVVGHPTLRLIRYAIGPWTLGSLSPGQWQDVHCPENQEEFKQFYMETDKPKKIG